MLPLPLSLFIFSLLSGNSNMYEKSTNDSKSQALNHYIDLHVQDFQKESKDEMGGNKLNKEITSDYKF